jgi:hypothetical protein
MNKPTHAAEVLASVPMPKRIANLPRDPERGYPIPYFVAVMDGKHDFRVADAEKRYRCIKDKRCWICGERLGHYLAFVIGPMCSVNRISSEPPMHRDCAEYSVQVCPFLLNPNQKRNPKKTDWEVDPPGGIMIPRNPGCMVMWMTTSYELVRDHQGGVLCHVGDPVNLHWYAEGRAATRAEVMESIRTGLPILQEIAAKEGPIALKLLDKQYQAALKLLPP